ncbi:MAG: hypothetical protein F6K44_03890 [Moorea sp. SIO3E2]|nr:hypothetical protein [Moorena sp. SIO3E2]
MSKFYTVYNGQFPYYVTKSKEDAIAKYESELSIAQAIQNKALPKKYTVEEDPDYTNVIIETKQGKFDLQSIWWLQEELYVNQNKTMIYVVNKKMENYQDKTFTIFRTYDIECAVHLLEQLNKSIFSIDFYISLPE